MQKNAVFMKYLVFILSVLQQKVDAKVSSSLSKVKSSISDYLEYNNRTLNI